MREIGITYTAAKRRSLAERGLTATPKDPQPAANFEVSVPKPPRKLRLWGVEYIVDADKQAA